MQDSHYESDMPESAKPRLAEMVAGATRWAGAILSLGLVIGIVYWAFSLGQRDAQDVPVIRAMAGAARVAPDDPAGSQAENQGLAVNEVLAQATPTVIDTETTLAPTTQTVETEDESMAVLEVDTVNTETTEQPVTAEPVHVDAASAMVEIEQPVVPRVAADGMELPLQRPESFSTNDPLSDAIEGLLQELQPEEGDTSLEVPDLPRPAPQFGNPLLDPGAALVQLGAYNSVSDATEAWGKYQRVHGDLLGNLMRYIEPIEVGGRVLYRLRAAGLNDLDQTRALCAALEARDVDCISVTVQ